jgi:hypothetical protein
MRYALATLLVAVTGSAANGVTLEMSQFVNANRLRAFVFQGSISSRQGGEYVEILGRYCGASGDRLISGTRTTGGGAYRVENPLTEPPYTYTVVYSGTAFRARWNGEYSEPRLWQLPAQPRVARISGTRTWVAHVTPATPTGEVGFQGKTIELQRSTPGGWVRVRTARLVRRASLRWGAFNYQARFTVPTRGLRLRAYLPAASAAPCYLPGGSESWRS